MGSLLFSSFFVLCPWALALDGWGWVFTGKLRIGDSGSPPAVLGWMVTILLTAFAIFLTAGWLGLWRREWMRLDSTGFTHRFPWFFRRRPPAVYQWTLCGPFTVREVPVSDGRSAWQVECAYNEDTFTLGDDPFGDPRDLATILNAYRDVYLSDADCDATHANADAADTIADLADSPAPSTSRRRTKRDSSPLVLRCREAQRLDRLTGAALREALTESTWSPKPGVRYAELGMIAFCGGGFAVFCLAAVLTEPLTPATRVVLIGGGTLLTGTIAYVVCALRNPPWVRLDADGLTVGGARLLWPLAQPRLHRWEDCGQFALHVITGEVDRTVVRCALNKGHLKIESIYGDPYDLVPILNAYRTVYGSRELR